MKKSFKVVMFLICLGTLMYSAISLYSIFNEYAEGDSAYAEAESSVTTKGEIETPVIETEVTEPSKQYQIKEIVSLDVDWESYPETVIGWIQIPNEDGSNLINYPVVQSQDNDYYLKHLYDGTENGAGSIFVDYRNEEFGNRHTAIYGHNMKNGSMFTSIKKYQEEDWANEHRYIYVATRDGGTRVFWVFACFLTDARGEETGFNAYQLSFDGDEWSEWIKTTQEKSLIPAGIEMPEKGNVITLSTCMSRGDQYERCTVHAIEISNKQLVEITE